MKDITSNKRLAINLISNIVSYSSTLLITFILTPYLINQLGKEAYSFYPLANNFVSYMSILTTALNSMANRFITIELVNKNYKKANQYFSSVFYSNILMGFLLLIPMILIIHLMDSFINIPINLVASIKILFSFVFASMILNIGTSVFGVATFATNRVDLRSLSELILSVLRIFLFIILFKFLSPTIIYVGVVAFIISIFNLGIQIFYTNRLIPEIKLSLKNYSAHFVIKLLSSGIWNSINQLGNILLVNTSLLLSNILYGASASGSYSIVQTVPNFINGIIATLTTVFIPTITRKYAKNDLSGMLQEVRKSQKIIAFVTSIVISVFIGLSYNFFQLWVPYENARELQVLSTITILPHIIICSVWTVSNLNIVTDHLKIPSLYMIGSGVLNICLVYFIQKIFSFDIILIPIISSIIQIIWVGFFIPIYPCLILGVNKYYFYPTIIKTILSTFLIYIVTIFIKSYFYINSWILLFIVSGICGLIGLLINFFIILDKHDKIIIFKLFKKSITRRQSVYDENQK